MLERSHEYIEVGRGVYDAPRAAALSGVPQSTLHYWARTDLYRPSISPHPRVRLWSWADLLALRAIDWLRRVKGHDQPRKTSMQRIRQALRELDRQGLPRERLQQLVLVSQGGELFLKDDGSVVRAIPGLQAGWPEMLDLVLVARYRTGPNLLEPRSLLRIIPGKLHGEPHLLGTRITSATVYTLHENGYGTEQIRAMYPEASSHALRQAIDLEQSLVGQAA